MFFQPTAAPSASTMPVLQINDQQYSLQPGQTRVGGAGADVRVGTEALGIQAVVEVAPDNQAIIRRASPAAAVKVNGVPLGVEPTPLIHGDKVEIAGTELLFADDKKVGATEYVSADAIAELVQKRTAPARATAATGGRLVSLVDGKEYTIPATGVVIGRDASSDVVVAQSEVSRRHAGILPVENGYVIQDYSTNGVFVNGGRVQQSQLLSRADVVRIGTEEFRFYADLAPAAPKAAPSAPAAAAPPPAPGAPPKPVAPVAPVAPPPAAAPSAPTVPAPKAPAAAAADTRPVLATLEVVNEGVNKGQKYEIRDHLVHVGRGAHNDIVIADDSVSDAHAKLQRRDDGWYASDLGSTNGTYVGGTRLTGDRRLDGAPDVRFGGVKMIFRSKGAVEEAKGTRAIVVDKAVKERVTRPTASPVAEPAAAEKKGGIPAVVWIVVVLAIAAVAFFVLKG